ncbi:FADD family protein [Megaselia abdita]
MTTDASMRVVEDRLRSKTLTEQEFQDVLELFENDISFSLRTFSSIRNMRDLLQMLNTLDICNDFDLTAYLDIAHVLGDSELYQHLKHKKPETQMLGENLYALERISKEEEEQVKLMEQLSLQKNKDLDNYNGFNVEPTTTTVQVNFTATSLGHGVKKKIYKVINDGIGRKWREFGRELNIPEGDMDKFSENADTRVIMILQQFENDPTRQPTRFIFDLAEALTNCRRKNLAKDIMSILANN